MTRVALRVKTTPGNIKEVQAKVSKKALIRKNGKIRKRKVRRTSI